MKFQKKLASVVVAALLITSLFAGCSKSEDGSTGNKDSSSTAVTSSGAAETNNSTQEVKSSTPKIIKLVLPLPTSLDPQLWTWGTHHAKMGIFEGLTKLDANLKPVPANAESWKHNDDYTVWTFTLKKDLKWSDGTPLNAHDYEYSIKRAINPETYAGKSGAFITGVPIKNADECMKGKAAVDDIGVKALDDYTLEITLSKPSTILDSSLTESWALPVPKKVIEAKGQDWGLPENIISNGPYKVKSFTPNVSVILEKNSNYYGEVNLDGVEVLNVQNQMLPYQNGDLNIASLSQADMDMVAKDSTLSKEMSTYKTGIVYFMDLLLSENDILQKNPKVRQAISMSIDKNLIANDIMKNTVRTGNSMVPEIWAAWGNDIGLKYDQARAKELMSEAGFPDGKGIPEMTIFIAGAPTGRELAIADQITKGTGIKVKLVNEEWAKFVTEYQKLQPKETFGYFISGGGTAFASYMGYFTEDHWNPAANLLTADAAKGYFKIRDDSTIEAGKKNDMLVQYIYENTQDDGRRYLDMVRKAASTLDPKEQENLYKQAGEFREQLATSIALDWENGVKLIKPGIKGYIGNALLLGAPPLYYNDLYMEDAK